MSTPEERQLVLSPTPLGDDHILGLREYAARIDFEGGKAELDHSFGFGALSLALSVHFDDGTGTTETVSLNEMVTVWVNRIIAEHRSAMPADPAMNEGKEGK